MVERSWFRAYFPLFTSFEKKWAQFLHFFSNFGHFLLKNDQKFDCFPPLISYSYHFFTIFLWFSNFFYSGWSNDHGFWVYFPVSSWMIMVLGVFSTFFWSFLLFFSLFLNIYWILPKIWLFSISHGFGKPFFDVFLSETFVS